MESNNDRSHFIAVCAAETDSAALQSFLLELPSALSNICTILLQYTRLPGKDIQFSFPREQKWRLAQAKNRCPIEKGIIYINPPGTCLYVAGNRIMLASPEQKPRYPAAELIRSIIYKKGNAVSVIFPGSMNGMVTVARNLTKSGGYAVVVQDKKTKPGNASFQKFLAAGIDIMSDARKTVKQISGHINPLGKATVKDRKKSTNKIAEQNNQAGNRVKENELPDIIINSLPGVFYLYDETGRFIRWNKNFEIVSGYRTEEVAGMHPLDFYADDEKQLIAGKIARVFKNGADEVEAFFFTKDRRKIPYFFNGRSVEFEGRKCLIGMGIDISGRKKAEAGIVASDNRFRHALDKMLEGVQIYDENWHCLYANDAALLQGPYPREQLMKNSLLENYPGIENTELFKIFKECIAEKKPRHIEYEFVFPDNTKTWYELSLQPLPEGFFILSIDISERKNSEKIIRDSEEKRRLIMNASLDAIICIDTAGRITFWNPQAEKIFGWKDAEVNGRVLSEVIIPEPYRKMHDKGMENYFRTGKASALNVLLEMTAIDRDGKQFPVELTVLPIKQGNEEFFCGFARDISARKKTEETIRLSNERYNIVAQASNDSIWDWDIINNEVVRDGKRLETIFGYEGWEPAEVDHYWNKLAHAEDWAKVTLRRQAIFKDIAQNYWEDEYRFLKSDGGYAYVYDRGYIIRNNEGKAVRMIGASQDISERKAAEETLRNSEMRFRSLIEKSNDIIALHDARGKILYISPSVETLLGYKPEDRIGRTALDAVHPDDLPRMKMTLAGLIDKPGSIVTAQWRHLHNDGSWHWMDGIATNLLNDPAVNAVVHNFRDITAQKEAEEKIKEERNLLRTLINNTPDAIYVKDALGRKLVSNKIDLEIMNVASEAEVIGKTDLELYPDSFGTQAYGVDMQVINSGVPHLRAEQEFINAQGVHKWLLTSKVPLRNETGEVIGLVGIGTDITHLKKVEAELLQSNERFKYATKATFDAIWDWNLITDSIYWGEGFETLFGYRIENSTDGIQTWISHIHPEDVDRVINGIQEVINSSGNNWSSGYRYLKANGEYAYVLDKGIVIRDEHGKGIRMIGAMHDNTIKKKEEEQLKLLESVITHTTDSILITEAGLLDGSGPRIMYVNDSFTEMTGYSREEVIGQTPRILQGPETDREELARLRLALEKWEPCKIEIINYKKNGEAFWINISVVPVANEKGLFTHWIAVERDVTERKLAEEELKEKNNELKRLSTYLQNVREEERKYMAREIHDELGQLASALKIDIDWLTIKVTNLEEIAKKRIDHANRTIEILINSIRKIASSLRPSVLDDFGLNAALKWHCAEFRNLNGIQCIFEPGFDDSSLSMHMKTELFRIAQESLTNVMRHAAASSVLVTTKEDADNFTLIVTDNGKGFDINQRKNTLGLVGLRERAASLNGSLEINSITGKGTMICAVVPKTNKL